MRLSGDAVVREAGIVDKKLLGIRLDHRDGFATPRME